MRRSCCIKSSVNSDDLIQKFIAAGSKKEVYKGIVVENVEKSLRVNKYVQNLSSAKVVNFLKMVFFFFDVSFIKQKFICLKIFKVITIFQINQRTYFDNKIITNRLQKKVVLTCCFWRM